MNTKDFIKKKIEEIVPKYSGIEIKYEQNQNTYTHTLEILPLSIFEDNSAYAEDELDFETEFETLFPEEKILFVSEGSLNRVNSPEFSIKNNNAFFRFRSEQDSNVFSFKGTDIIYLEQPIIPNYANAV